MNILFGLGNPGAKFEKTRHTVGARFIEWLAKKLDTPLKEERSTKNRIARAQFNTTPVTLAASGCWMNESGRCATQLLLISKEKPKRLWVFHDDSDLDFSEVKISLGRGAAGHHGVESLFSALKTKSFQRVRIGVRPREEIIRRKAGDFIVKPFSKKEEAELPKVFKKVLSLLQTEMSRNA